MTRRVGFPVALGEVQPCEVFFSPENAVPTHWLPRGRWSEAGTPMHTFTDDYRQEFFWRRPFEGLLVASAAGLVTAPDFTIFNDDPDEWAAYQAWRSATVAAFWQRHGVSVIPVAAFRGAPERWVSPGSVWAVRGPARSSLGSWYREIDAFVDRAEPSRLVVFGNPVAEAICSVPVENRALFSRTCAAAQKEGQNHGR